MLLRVVRVEVGDDVQLAYPDAERFEFEFVGSNFFSDTPETAADMEAATAAASTFLSFSSSSTTNSAKQLEHVAFMSPVGKPIHER